MTLRSLCEIEVGGVGDDRGLVANSVDGSIDHSIDGLFQSSVVVSSLYHTLILAVREKRMFLVTFFVTLVLALFLSKSEDQVMMAVSCICQRQQFKDS